MFKLESMLLEKIRSAFNPMQPVYAGINYMAVCATCQGTCKNSCTSGCKGGCKGGCTRSCKGSSR